MKDIYKKRENKLPQICIDKIQNVIIIIIQNIFCNTSAIMRKTEFFFFGKGAITFHLIGV